MKKKAVNGIKFLVGFTGVYAVACSFYAAAMTYNAPSLLLVSGFSFVIGCLALSDWMD